MNGRCRRAQVSHSVEPIPESQPVTTNTELSPAVGSTAAPGGAAAAGASPAPLFSFGVPVRNAAAYLPRLLDSLLAQTVADLEVVLSDNCSDDGTVAVCEEYARRDPRVRLHRNSEDLGQIANFNRTVELARGRYFRWIGADDWLEPTYIEACVGCFREHPDAVGITTFQDHVDDQGRTLYAEYRGERLASKDLGQRFSRMLWAFTANYLYFDPIYSAMRREVLMRSRRLQIVPNMDQVLAAELITVGPFEHVPQCLSHRRRQNEVEDEQVYRRYAKGRHSELDPTTWRLLRAFSPLPWRVEATVGQRLRCLSAVARHVIVTACRRWLTRMRRWGRPAKAFVRRLGGGTTNSA